MAEIVEWPYCVLTPLQPAANIVPFTRSGGRSLGGLEPKMRTDRGWWTIDYGNIPILIRNRNQWRTWNAIRQKLGGGVGRIAVRIPVSASAPYATGSFEAAASVTHSDGSTFSDGSKYRQRAISVKAEGGASIGDTQISLRIVNAAADLSGVRFSYQHAAYETGPLVSVSGDVWTVPISPAVRAAIPDGAELEFDRPTCLCNLASDRAMDLVTDVQRKSTYPSVSFVEAVDFWSNLAAGVIESPFLS